MLESGGRKESPLAYDPRIDAYIDRARPFARPILTRVRERVHAACPQAEETLKWGAPSFTLDGKILLMMAAFKQHAALNFWRGQELRGSAAEADGMGQFGKLTSLDDLPPDEELDALIRQAAELTKTAPAPRKTKHPPKPAELHPEFAAALDRAPKAKATLDSFPPSAKRDYLEWIAEAKQDSTRQKRIATAIEWLSEGKRRNWKYERC
ncbi:MAG TPA: YdeI/OmpD-associated family protein [Sphingomicrobium sp.]|nr:YdeI/OmpD-associated family protein [Sphingomicrobium sp.]